MKQEKQKRTHIFSGSTFEELAGYSRAVVVGDHIYVLGPSASTSRPENFPKMQQDRRNRPWIPSKRPCTRPQSGLHDVVRVRVFLTSPDHVPAVSSVLKQRVGFTRPVNTTVCTA
ncbi:MAG: RidA family protein, partial [SAR324 cluster bacterium]|nr:RidA family protein [SAR324 cluster bacterium]